MKVSKKIILIPALVVTAALVSGYVFFSGGRSTVSLPGEVKVIPLEFTKVFLIPVNNGYLLIDNGYEKEYGRFLKGLDEHNIDIMDIKYLMITHHHDDHAGFLNKMTARNKTLRVILHEKSVPLLAAGENNKKNGGGIINHVIYALFRIKMLITPDWDFRFPPYIARKQDIVLRGERTPLPEEVGLARNVIHTPGHSSDSVSLIYKDKYLFCGDMASSFLLWAGARHCTLFNEDISQVYDSWEKVLSLNIEFLLPAHGKPFHADRLKEDLYKYAQKDLVVYF